MEKITIFKFPNEADVEIIGKLLKSEGRPLYTPDNYESWTDSSPEDLAKKIKRKIDDFFVYADKDRIWVHKDPEGIKNLLIKQKIKFSIAYLNCKNARRKDVSTELLS